MSRLTIAARHLEDLTDDELAEAEEHVRIAKSLAPDAHQDGFDEDLAEIAAARASRGPRPLNGCVVGAADASNRGRFDA